MTQEAPTAVLKLQPVLDMAAAEELLVTLRQQVAHDLCLDASAVASITTPCIQMILAAAASNGVSVQSPSEEFSAAFSDLGLSLPQASPVATEAASVSEIADAPPLQPDHDEKPAPSSISVSAQAEVTPMAKRILTIDDSKTIRDMLKMTLVDAGFEVLQAVDGEDGIAMMGREQVDLVITDINMPKMNGYEVVRRLRSNPANKGLPILVLTTESDTDKKNLAREAGATGWMVKPFDPDRLIATVRKVIP